MVVARSEGGEDGTEIKPHHEKREDKPRESIKRSTDLHRVTKVALAPKRDLETLRLQVRRLGDERRRVSVNLALFDHVVLVDKHLYGGIPLLRGFVHPALDRGPEASGEVAVVQGLVVDVPVLEDALVTVDNL
jgi:hypothetical protein